MNAVFMSLEEEAFFVAYVTGHFEQAPRRLSRTSPALTALIKVRIIFAHGEYAQNIKQYAVLLDSENPAAVSVLAEIGHSQIQNRPLMLAVCPYVGWRAYP
jgi:hypothetical protein